MREEERGKEETSSLPSSVVAAFLRLCERNKEGDRGDTISSVFRSSSLLPSTPASAYLSPPTATAQASNLQIVEFGVWGRKIVAMFPLLKQFLGSVYFPMCSFFLFSTLMGFGCGLCSVFTSASELFSFFLSRSMILVFSLSNPCFTFEILSTSFPVVYMQSHCSLGNLVNE
ncbi:hypothetical protein EJ110_NYTH12987 [Nymphaea thermarum]|nr:hypothetical protein EJ110_NYTH12987 [Nymphaea thermarum]